MASGKIGGPVVADDLWRSAQRAGDLYTRYLLLKQSQHQALRLSGFLRRLDQIFAAFLGSVVPLAHCLLGDAVSVGDLAQREPLAAHQGFDR